MNQEFLSNLKEMSKLKLMFNKDLIQVEETTDQTIVRLLTLEDHKSHGLYHRNHLKSNPKVLLLAPRLGILHHHMALKVNNLQAMIRTLALQRQETDNKTPDLQIKDSSSLSKTLTKSNIHSHKLAKDHLHLKCSLKKKASNALHMNNVKRMVKALRLRTKKDGVNSRSLA